MTPIPRTTVTEVLACLEEEFAEVAAAFARGEYLLWLGSGLSRGVVPDVRALLQRLLDFLQSNFDQADPACRFRRALEELLEVAGVVGELRDDIDLSASVETWPSLAMILDRMIDKYSEVLDVSVDGEADDYLVWNGIDIPSTYGSPGLLPDVEHLCVAILMLEGVVRSAPTTNWDGLVEAAMTQLADDPDTVLNVIVHPNDFTLPHRRSELVKFHGCAVRAAATPATYRDLLIARKSQISGWTTKPENQMMKARLEYLLRSQPALVIGLSAQDANIHTMLHQATQNLARGWPSAPPSVVFAVQQLGPHHKHMLKVTYSNDYTPNRDQIDKSALLGAYAQPALVGLVLYVLTDKLCSLIEALGGHALPSGEVVKLQDDLRGLRDVVGQFAHPNPRGFIDAVIAATSLVLTVFRTGRGPCNRAIYTPLSIDPISGAIHDPNFPREPLGHLALAAALIGRGMAKRAWAVAPGGADAITEGSLRITNGRGQTSRVFLVANHRVLTELEQNGHVDMGDEGVLVLYGEATRRPSSRGPHARYGRSGESRAREVDLESITASVSTANELFEAFELEGVL